MALIDSLNEVGGRIVPLAERHEGAVEHQRAAIAQWGSPARGATPAQPRMHSQGGKTTPLVAPARSSRPSLA